MEKKKNLEKKENLELFESSENDVFNAEDLFAIQGGEDDDLDDDCYNMQCVLAANFCINAKCIISG